MLDAAHLLTGAAGGTGDTMSVRPNDPSARSCPAPSSASRRARHRLRAATAQALDPSVRYLDRRLKRVVEDAAVVALERADFFGQTYFIGNVTRSSTRRSTPSGVHAFCPAATSPRRRPGLRQRRPRRLLPAPNGQPAGSSGADGVADGLRRDPQLPSGRNRAEQALLEGLAAIALELAHASRKRQLRGHFRNDNGQTDPAISCSSTSRPASSTCSATSPRSARSTQTAAT